MINCKCTNLLINQINIFYSNYISPELNLVLELNCFNVLKNKYDKPIISSSMISPQLKSEISKSFSDKLKLYTYHDCNKIYVMFDIQNSSFPNSTINKLME